MLSIVRNMCKPSTDFVVTEQLENGTKCRCLPKGNCERLVQSLNMFLENPSTHCAGDQGVRFTLFLNMNFNTCDRWLENKFTRHVFWVLCFQL
jgi:hypothetical protein